MLLQDIVVTVDLKDMTKEEYKATLKVLEKISLSPIDTLTYEEGTSPGEADLSPESQALYDDYTN